MDKYPRIKVEFAFLPKSLCGPLLKVRKIANGHSPSLLQRLLADLVPALIVGGIVLGAGHWLRHRNAQTAA